MCLYVPLRCRRSYNTPSVNITANDVCTQLIYTNVEQGNKVGLDIASKATPNTKLTMQPFGTKVLKD